MNRRNEASSFQKAHITSFSRFHVPPEDAQKSGPESSAYPTKPGAMGNARHFSRDTQKAVGTAGRTKVFIFF
jgi:hypothetical protein